MTNAADRVEIITSVQRRRRWTASEKVPAPIVSANDGVGHVYSRSSDAVPGRCSAAPDRPQFTQCQSNAASGAVGEPRDGDEQDRAQCQADDAEGGEYEDLPALQSRTL